MEVNIRPYFRRRRGGHGKMAENGGIGEKEQAEERRKDERDVVVIRQMWFMIGVGLSVFLGGFGIWTLDNKYCSTLRRWRHEIGLPWGILLEGHGWWHLMTGLGAYFYIAWGIWLRHCLNDRQDEYELVWPSLFTSIPRVMRRTQAMNGANGHAKRMM
ncbi:alkaline ceramidase ydc1 [Friedmanniomyces endolithicus]|nr:alkaline ceramidase ydc1 [Friedmanniomyces endolithicus]